MIRKTALLFAVAFVAGLLGTAASAHADTVVNNPSPTPVIQPLNCFGGTGSAGCGPGWVWNGARCVPC